MKKPKSTAQYLKDKLYLGSQIVEKRNIGVYMDESINDPAISEELLSEVSNELLSSSYDKRRAWFERASETLSNGLFAGARREIAGKLLEKQKINPFYIDLIYRPQRLVSEAAKNYVNTGEYYESLFKSYSLHIYEDSLSLLISTVKYIAGDLETEDLTDQEIDFYVKQAERKFLSILWLDPGITPEERKVLRSQAMKQLREHNEEFGENAVSDFVQLRLNQDKLVGEIKAKFDPELGYYGSRFSNTIHGRIINAFYRESRIGSIDDETSNINVDDDLCETFNPATGDFSSLEAYSQAQFLFSALDKALSKEDKFLFLQKYVEEYSHEKIAQALREEFESKREIKETNIPYMIKRVLADLEKALEDAGVDDSGTVLDGLISFLTGKKPKQ
ncbi:hypothetical protein [Glaciecola sp. 1036]|uniref:hypothetical protein n=1 Tax=Alteromonadaceae TaxID=72275 RepID=UPI003D05905B